MARRATILALGASLLVASSGCRHPWLNRDCSSPGRGSGSGSGTGCGTGATAGTGCRQSDSCFDPMTGMGMPVSGPTGIVPGTLIPGSGVPLMPGGGMGDPSNVLPFPGVDRIPPPSVPSTPSAPRTPAPGEFGAGDASKIAQPARGK